MTPEEIRKQVRIRYELLTEGNYEEYERCHRVESEEQKMLLFDEVIRKFRSKRR